jgi:hypothetical protein
MKKLLCLAVALAIQYAAGIGPVGAYLGYRLGIQAVTQGWLLDSVHLTLPSPSDTTIYAVARDTTALDSELVYRNLPGYLFETRTWTNGSPSTGSDTTYESTGVYLKQKQFLVDTYSVVTRYEIPFSVNSWWRTGTAGTYYVDFGHNDTIDTVSIWADTTRVIGTEDVTTPYGTVAGCYKLLTRFRSCIKYNYGGVLMRDSELTTTIEWYKDSLWKVRDSVHSDGRIYVFIIIWLRAGNMVTDGAQELWALSPTGIREPHDAVARFRFAEFGPSPFRGNCVIKLRSNCPSGRLRILAPDGEEVFSASIRDQVVWQPRNLPQGVYHLVFENRLGRYSLGRVIYLR